MQRTLSRTVLAGHFFSLFFVYHEDKHEGSEQTATFLIQATITARINIVDVVSTSVCTIDNSLVIYPFFYS